MNRFDAVIARILSTTTLRLNTNRTFRSSSRLPFTCSVPLKPSTICVLTKLLVQTSCSISFYPWKYPFIVNLLFPFRVQCAIVLFVSFPPQLFFRAQCSNALVKNVFRFFFIPFLTPDVLRSEWEKDSSTLYTLILLVLTFYSCVSAESITLNF